MNTPSPALALLDKYPVSPEQREIIKEAATKSPDYQKWFVEQFTRNRQTFVCG